MRMAPKSQRAGKRPSAAASRRSRVSTHLAVDGENAGSERQQGLADFACRSVAAVKMVAGFVLLTHLQPFADSVRFRLVHSQLPQSFKSEPNLPDRCTSTSDSEASSLLGP